MKILQVISSLGNGGAEKFVVELCNELSKKNDVTLCSFKKIEDWMIFPKKKNFNVKIIQFNKRNGHDISVYFNLIKLVRKEKIEIIHFHLDSTIKYILPLLIFFTKAKFYYTIHSNLNSDKIKLFDSLYRAKAITRKIKYICISQLICDEFQKKYPNFTFALVENGIAKLNSGEMFEVVKDEVEKLKLNSDTKVFSCIGNYSLITSVFARLYNEKYNVILLLIGNDTSANMIEWNKIKESKSANTFMLGLKSNIQDYLLLSDAYCLCSHYEGLPISILEAYSLGIPVLSTPAGGIPSILRHSFNGYLSENFTFDAYYKMLIDFINVPSDYLKKVRENNLLHFINNFTIEKTADKYTEIYKL